MQKSPVTPILLLLFLVGTIVLMPDSGFPQDGLDLGIPGLEEEEAPTIPSNTDSAPATATDSVNLLDMIRAGGWSMWVLGAFSLGLIGLLVYCLIDLQKRNFHPSHLVQSLYPDMEQADMETAMGRIRSSQTCLGATLEAGFHHIVEFGYESLGTEKLEEVMAAAARKFNRGRVRTINYFSILAQAAPMMGLLGTVSGMIGAFAKLSQGGTGDPSKFAGNISEALITTASGLVIALPSIFCYFIFRDRLQSLVADCDEKAEELMAHLRRAVHSFQNEG